MQQLWRVDRTDQEQEEGDNLVSARMEGESAHARIRRECADHLDSAIPIQSSRIRLRDAGRPLMLGQPGGQNQPRNTPESFVSAHDSKITTTTDEPDSPDVYDS